MTTAILLIFLASAVILHKNRQLIPHYVVGGLCCLPLLLIDPLLRVGYFEQLSAAEILKHFTVQFLFTFLFGGVSAISYELLFGPIFVKRRSNTRYHLQAFLVGAVIAIGLLFFSELSLAACVIVGLIINTVILIAWRPDLLWDATFSAIGTGLLYVLLFTLIIREPGQIQGLWFIDGLSGLTAAGLPIEELLIVGLFGAFFGPIYIATKSLYER